MTRLATIARQSSSVTEALANLHLAGASPARAVVALVRGTRMNMGDAKRAVHDSPHWSEVIARSVKALLSEFDDTQEQMRKDP